MCSENWNISNAQSADDFYKMGGFIIYGYIINEYNSTVASACRAKRTFILFVTPIQQCANLTRTFRKFYNLSFLNILKTSIKLNYLFITRVNLVINLSRLIITPVHFFFFFLIKALDNTGTWRWNIFFSKSNPRTIILKQDINFLLKNIFECQVLVIFYGVSFTPLSYC